MRRCLHTFLGRIDYSDALQLQQICSRKVKEGDDERLLLLEHPPVITLGRNARQEDVLLDEDGLRARGVSVASTDRGGQVTYHGPGQLVGYPILNLSPDRRDVSRYLRDLEEVLIRTLKHFDVPASRIDGLTGVWVGEDKIASIGVHLSRWVTTHGFALNVSTDLDPFSFIVPCGLRARRIASMQTVLGRRLPLEEVALELIPVFASVFGREMIREAAPSTEVPRREAS